MGTEILRFAQDDKLFPILVGKNHYRVVEGANAAYPIILYYVCWLHSEASLQKHISPSIPPLGGCCNSAQ